MARRSWGTIPRIRPYLKGQWRLASGSSVLVVLSALFYLLEPWPLALLVDGVLGNSPPPSWLTDIVGDGRFTLLGVAVGLGFIVTAGIHGLAVVTEYINTKLDQNMVLDFRSDLFRHCHRLSFGWHSDRSTGQLMNRINFQANSMGAVTLAFPPMVESLITVIGMFIVAYTIDPQLALIAMTVVPFVYYSVGHYTNRVEPEVRRVKGMEAENMNIVHEAVAMLRVVVSFGRERHEYRRFREQGEKTVRSRVRVTVRQTLFSMAVALITAAGTALVLWFGASNVLRGRLSVGQLLVVISYIAAVYTPLQGISSAFATLQEQVVGLHMAFELLDTQPEVKEKPNAIALERAEGDVKFEDVSFSYGDRTDTLVDISFEAKPGEAIALVGPTGAGKSTIVSLIPRFHDPQKGRVLLDGHDLRDLKLDSVRNQISVVLQDPQLFSGTIEENIRYGRLDASEEEIVEAAKAANAHDFIMRLPKKYETRVGEGGAKLSGGERQRISIARAFIRDAPILILDEPTSSIDSKTEQVILDALDRIMEGRTTFIIAHRLSTVHHADTYLVIQDGRIVEQGNHHDLLERGGLYRQLWDAQSRRRGGRGKRRLPAPEDVLAKKIAAMARSLGSPKPRVQQWARQALARLDRATVREWAGEALRSDNKDEAVLGARVAGALRLVAHGTMLLDRAAALPPPERAPFVEALLALRLEPGTLVDLLDEVRRAGNAVHIVRRVGGPGVIPLLRRRLVDANPAIRASVLHVLSIAGEAEALTAAQAATSLDSAPGVRAAALGVLRRSLPWEKRRAYLSGALADPSPQVRARALSLLPMRLDEQVLAPILGALGDGYERVWREARRYVLRLDEHELRLIRVVMSAYLRRRHDALDVAVDRSLPDVDVGLLMGALGEVMREPIDDELLTRQEAARRAGVSVATLGRWEREGILRAQRLEAGPKVLARVRTADLLRVIEDGRVAARPRSWTSRTSKVLRSLLRTVMDAEPHRGLVVTQHIVRLLGHDRFVAQAQENLDAEIRVGAVEALALIGGDRAVGALTSAAADPNEGVRVRALELLAQIRHPQAAHALKRVQDRIRQAADRGMVSMAELQAAERAFAQTNGHADDNGATRDGQARTPQETGI